jgi:hypothetical protein
MVVIHIKRDDSNQYLYETSCGTSNDELITGLVTVWNMRIKLQFLVDNVRELAKHGPMKPPDQRGLDEIKEEEGEKIEKGQYYQSDPLGNRTGNGPGPQLADTIEKVSLDALAAINKNQVALKVALNVDMLSEKFDNIRGSVMMAYPMGLPEYDTVKGLLDDNEEFVEGQAAMALLDPKSATLWWAGKEFFRDQLVGDRVGKNEKTKIVAKIQGKGSGPPAREPAVSEAERSAMMAHYFKKQEELKKVAEADDDEYLGSAWANPQSMKQGLRGVGNIKPF